MSNQERVFEHYIDPVDGILCIPAGSEAAGIAREASPHGLRFPLIIDESAPLCEQVASSPFAPASSRYGPYCDNITGMNWELPDGRVVRVGERVVKSTTGYDLLRFLLASGNRYGRAVDYVLRLRPSCDTSLGFCLRGDVGPLQTASKALLQSSWMHWFDSVDLVVETAPFLRVWIHCPGAELSAYEKYLSDVAAKFSLILETEATNVLDGCPDLAVKTSPEFSIETALDLTKRTGAKCIVLCYCGVVHAYLPGNETIAIDQLVAPIESRLTSIGGHWQSRHVQRTPSPLEATWISTLRKEWKIL